MGVREKVAFVLIIAIGVIGSGVANYALTEVGAPTLGTIVWMFGYAMTVFVLWYIWIRPLDITGPNG